MNLVLSVALVFRFGLVGIAVGTVVAMLYHTIYFVCYLRKNILNRSPLHFIKHIAIDSAIGVVTMLLTQKIVLSELSYLSWGVYATQVAAITIAVAIVVGGLANYKNVIALVKKIKKC